MNPIIEQAPLLALAAFSIICIMAVHTKLLEYLFGRIRALEAANTSLANENAALRDERSVVRASAG